MIMDYDNDNDDNGCQFENLKLPPIGSTAPAPASPCISRSLYYNDDGDDEHDEQQPLQR